MRDDATMNTCAECRFWKTEGNDFGECERTRTEHFRVTIGERAVAVCANNLAVLRTRSDFGCVQFEVVADTRGDTAPRLSCSTRNNQLAN